jgi:hypothetical protein
MIPSWVLKKRMRAKSQVKYHLPLTLPEHRCSLLHMVRKKTFWRVAHSHWPPFSPASPLTGWGVLSLSDTAWQHTPAGFTGPGRETCFCFHLAPITASPLGGRQAHWPGSSSLQAYLRHGSPGSVNKSGKPRPCCWPPTCHKHQKQ